MTSSVSMSNLVFSGTAATAASSIYQLMALYSTMSSQYDKLMILDTESSYKGADATSENTENAADQQAKQMRQRAWGSIGLGSLECLGVIGSITIETLKTPTIRENENQLKQMESNQKELKEIRTSGPDSVLSNNERISSEQNLETKQNMKDLTRDKDFSKEWTEDERNTIKLANDKDYDELTQKLDKQIGRKSDDINAMKKELYSKSDKLQQFSRSVGLIAQGCLEATAANHQEEAGKFEAAKVMSEETGKLADQMYQMDQQGSSKYFDMSLQLPEILTGLQQADSSQN
ncbi:MAG: hypothetical protein KDK56_09660 [Simkania sp.]|nr:hypothetical protein [Simkania sp.]MCP5489583.1 hypothetical protein [Chlamydiales bacterium]